MALHDHLDRAQATRSQRARDALLAAAGLIARGLREGRRRLLPVLQEGWRRLLPVLRDWEWRWLELPRDTRRRASLVALGVLAVALGALVDGRDPLVRP